MSAAIVNVIFGAEMPRAIRSFFEEADMELDNLGFESLYSASGDNPYYLGVRIYQMSYDTMTVESFNKRIEAALTPSRIDKVANYFSTIRSIIADSIVEWEEKSGEKISDDKRQELMEAVPTKPEIFILWSDS